MVKVFSASLILLVCFDTHLIPFVNFDLLHGTVQEIILPYSVLSKITHRIEQIVLNAVFDDEHTRIVPFALQPKAG
jgi:hypothetical protein